MTSRTDRIVFAAKWHPDDACAEWAQNRALFGWLKSDLKIKNSAFMAGS